MSQVDQVTFFRRPGCLLWGFFLVVGLCCASGLAQWMQEQGWVGDGLLQSLAIMVITLLVAFGLARLFRALTSRTRRVCPHCGVVTDPTFRVCRSCGRVK